MKYISDSELRDEFVTDTPQSARDIFDAISKAGYKLKMSPNKNQIMKAKRGDGNVKALSYILSNMPGVKSVDKYKKYPRGRYLIKFYYLE